MGKWVENRKMVILIVVIIIVIAAPISVYGYNNYNFNKLYNSGLEQIDKENFDSAINNFNASLKYKAKQKTLVESKISIAKEIKESKTAFDSAVAMQEGKKYLEAIDIFKTIKNTDTKRYNEAQHKIKECHDSYINENIASAKGEAANKSYEKAIAYLDIILKFDAGNKEVQALKDEYNSSIQQIAAEAEKAKKAEAEKLAAQKAAEAKNTTSKTTTTASTGTKSTTSGTDSVKSNSNLSVTLNGSALRLMALKNAMMSVQPNGIYYSVIEAGFGHPIDYDITFYLVGRTVKRSGKTSGEFQLISADFNEVPSGQQIKIVINFKLNGKVYTTSGYRVINNMRI